MTRSTSPQCMYLSVCVVSAKLEREEITNPNTTSNLAATIICPQSMKSQQAPVLRFPCFRCSGYCALLGWSEMKSAQNRNLLPVAKAFPQLGKSHVYGRSPV